MNEKKKPTMLTTAEADDPGYPYLYFVQERGWKYAEEKDRRDAYLRELLVRHGKVLDEEEFLAEAGINYAERARRIYPKLSSMARAGIISTRTLYNYARHLWCMKDSTALIALQTGKDQWEVNSCDEEIPLDKAKKIVCREWGFDEGRVSIHGPAYYGSSDWNFIRFHCGPLEWLMHDDSLYIVYQ